MRSNALLAALLVFGLAGCKATPSGQALTPELARNDPDAHLEFWHALPGRTAVSNDEAFHALLLFVDGEDPAGDYDARTRRLRELRMLPAGFDEPPAAVLRRGTLAVALARALDVRGGLTMRLFGAIPRYAVRELQYAGVYPPSSPQQTFSGAEFLGIIGRAEDYQRVRAQGPSSAEAPAMPTAAPAGPGGEGAADGGA